MRHRHLNHNGYTLAAIDDIIARGKRQDWAGMRDAALADKALMAKVLRIARTRESDRFAQRYHFWRSYAEQKLA